MLLMTASDEAELENWRKHFGNCQLSAKKMRPQSKMEDVLPRLPNIMSLLIRTRLKAGGWLGPMCLSGEEITEILSASKMARREVMVLLLDVASAMAHVTGDGNHIGAILEAESGAMYVGAPVAWQGKGVKFSAHGVQTALMNAWHQDETKFRTLMVETPPCACCRQFLRETWDWGSIKIECAEDGPHSLKTGAIKEIEFDQKGLKIGGPKGRLMGEGKRGINIGKSDANELINKAAEAAAMSYAPYSKNFAGLALRTKRGSLHQGRYAECSASIAGVMAIESALINVVLSNESIADITDIVLIEMRGTVTQFSPTQKLAQALGGIPFRFLMAGG